MKRVYHVDSNQKKAGVAILITQVTAFRKRNMANNEDGHFLILKGLIYQ